MQAMKTVNREHAIEIYSRLGKISIGKLNEEMLEAMMHNINAFRKVSEDFEALKKELFKRLYGNVEDMTEEEKADLQKFFGMLADIKDEDTEIACRKAFPAFYDARVKEIKVLRSLLKKDVEVDVEEVDESNFVKGIVLGNSDAKVNEIHLIFSPLFITGEKQETDLSELDELLNC